MGPKVHTKRVRRTAAVLALALPIALGSAASAWAGAAPPNDDFSNATVITTQPFHDYIADMSAATWDPSTDSSNCFGYGDSVWYTVTPTTSTPIAFDTAGSKNDMWVVDVFTGSPGSLSNVGCSFTGGYILNPVAGTQYWILVSPQSGLSGGSLAMTVYPAVAPKATIHVKSTGQVDRGGNATVSGTVNCTGYVVSPGSVTGNVRQVVRRLYSVTATFTDTSGCGGTFTWTVLAQPAQGGFATGYVTVNAAASICNLAGCATPSTVAVIKLRR